MTVSCCSSPRGLLERPHSDGLEIGLNIESFRLEFCALIRPLGQSRGVKNGNCCSGCEPGFELPSHYNISVILNKMFICVGLGFSSIETAINVQLSSLCYCEYINTYKILCTEPAILRNCRYLEVI